MAAPVVPAALSRRPAIRAFDEKDHNEATSGVCVRGGNRGRPIPYAPPFVRVGVIIICFFGTIMMTIICTVP